MNTMSVFRLGCIILIVLFGLPSCDDSENQPSTTLQPAKFVLPYNNTKFQRGKELPIEIDIPEWEKISHLKVFFKDTILFDGPPDKAALNFSIQTDQWSLGSRQLSLEAKMKDGKKRKDRRIIRVLSDIYPSDYEAEVVNVFPHATSSYTQGLEFDNGNLYEGTGGMGATGGMSMIARVDLNSGEILKKMTLDDEDFGEGITIMGDRLYQLTWQQNKCFVYDKNSFELLETFQFSGEGWGLCNDGKNLIMSDGSERIYFRDPKTFSLKNTIEVYSNAGRMRMLNELEYIDGKIYANIYQSDNIAIINPASGAVEGLIDASLISLDYRKGGEVLNGIAYQKEKDRLFITGKNWPNLIEIKLVPISL